jgi:hypothetical protein
LKFSMIVVIQRDYKILQLEFVKTLLSCFNFPISTRTPWCGSLKKNKNKELQGLIND